MIFSPAELLTTLNGISPDGQGLFRVAGQATLQTVLPSVILDPLPAFVARKGNINQTPSLMEAHRGVNGRTR